MVRPMTNGLKEYPRSSPVEKVHGLLQLAYVGTVDLRERRVD